MGRDDTMPAIPVPDLSRFRYGGELAEGQPARPETTGAVKQEYDAKTAFPGGIIPPILQKELYIVFVGFNPGIESGRTGHHYAHHSNRFWKFIYESELVDRPVGPEDDVKLPKEYGYGFTDLVARPSRGASDLSSSERLQGVLQLEERLDEVIPDFVCFVGKGIWESVCKVKHWSIKDFHWGLQSPTQLFGGGSAFVVPSTSGLVSLPKNDQLEVWRELKRLVDELKPSSSDMKFV